MITTAHAAAIVTAATALVLAPLNPQPIRDLNTSIPTPEPEPATEPATEPAVVANYDHYGSPWGHDTVTKAQADIAQAAAQGHAIDEWNVTDRDGQPLRIVRTTDPTSTFLGGIDISVIPVTDTAR